LEVVAITGWILIVSHEWKIQHPAHLTAADHMPSREMLYTF